MAHRIQEAAPPAVTLRFLPRGVARVQDYRALMEPPHVNRFHGWRLDPAAGLQGGYVKLTDAEIVVEPGDPYRAQYVQHAQQGDLWCADEATAAACGQPHEPHFGGEHPGLSAKLGLDGAKLRARLALHGFPEDAGAASVPWDTGFAPAAGGKPEKSAAEKLAAKDATPPAAPAPAGK